MAATGTLPSSGPSLASRAARAALITVAIVLAGLVVFLFSAASAFWIGLGMLAALGLAVFGFAWPTPATLVLLVLVPMTRFVSLLVFSATGSGLAVRASQVAKDGLLVILLFAVVNLAFQRRTLPRVHVLDLAVGLYVGIAMLYLLYPGVDGSSTSVFAKVLALRQDAFFLLAYFVGRGITLRRDTLVLLIRVVVWLSVAIAAYAVFQWVAPGLNNGALNRLGFSEFMATIGAPHETLAVRSRGIGAADLARASSFFLADLGLAFYQLLLVPLAGALYLFARRPVEQVGYGLFLLLMLAVLGMTVTRSAIVAGGVGLLYVLLLRPSYLRMAVIAAGLAGMGSAFAFVKGLDLGSLRALTSLSEGSASSHFSLIEQGVAAVVQYPLGLGLGNGSHVANQLASFGVVLPVSAIESSYLQIGLELGIPGMLAFIAMLLVAAFYAFANYFRVGDELLRMALLATGGIAVSVLTIGVVHPVWSAVHVTVLFWFFVGLAVRAPSLEREWQETGQLADRDS